MEQLWRFQECKLECRSLGRCKFLCVIKGEESGGWGRGFGVGKEEQVGEQSNGKRSAASQGDFLCSLIIRKVCQSPGLSGDVLWKTGKDTVLCLGWCVICVNTGTKRSLKRLRPRGWHLPCQGGQGVCPGRMDLEEGRPLGAKGREDRRARAPRMKRIGGLWLSTGCMECGLWAKFIKCLKDVHFFESRMSSWRKLSQNNY